MDTHTHKTVRHPSKLVRAAAVPRETGQLPAADQAAPVNVGHDTHGRWCRVCRKVRTRNGGRVCTRCLA